MLAALESMRTKRLNELVTLVQKNVRRRLEYKKYQDLRKKTIRIQSWWRGVLAQRYAEQLRKETAATKIQKVARGWMARKRYTEVRQAVVKIQSGESDVCVSKLTGVVVRGHQARKRALEERTNHAVLTLQSLFRGL
jgi:myosin-5